MAWPVTSIESWTQFAQMAERLAGVAGGQPAYMCRGQSVAAWTLTPSLVRLLPADISRVEALAVEKSGQGVFISQAHLHLPAEYMPVSHYQRVAEWWAIMQHYSSPTRLLDWTFSLYAAAYFAVNSNWDHDGAVFIVQGGRLINAMHEEYGTQDSFRSNQLLSEDPSARLFLWTPPRPSNRLVAQQGTFSLSSDILCDHGAIIDHVFTRHPSTSHLLFNTLFIPAQLKPTFVMHLRYMNISANSLFPVADGLGRSVSDAVRVALAPREAGAGGGG